jgi:hypothetical protein
MAVILDAHPKILIGQCREGDQRPGCITTSHRIGQPFFNNEPHWRNFSRPRMGGIIDVHFDTTNPLPKVRFTQYFLFEGVGAGLRDQWRFQDVDCFAQGNIRKSRAFESELTFKVPVAPIEPSESGDPSAPFPWQYILIPLLLLVFFLGWRLIRTSKGSSRVV